MMPRDLNKEAPDSAAAALAAKLTRSSPDATVINMLTESALKQVDPPAERDQQGDDDILEDEDEIVIEDDDGGEPPEDDNTEGADDDEGDEDEGDDEQEGDGDDFEEIDYDDSDEFEVKVDGETRKVTLRELKEAYSGEGAISKRLQEATETRNAARAERDTAQQEIATHRANLLRTIAALDGAIFAPMVDAPDEKLIAQGKNAAYLAGKRAYEEDQQRIKEGRAALATFMQGEQKQLEEARATYRTGQMELLRERMPELTDPAKAAGVQKDIYDAAAHYGFTPEQVAQVDNHALFLMARDASRWLKMQKIKSEKGTPTGGATSKAKRRMKPGGTATSAKAKAISSQKQVKTAEQTARRTGKVDDVAAMIAAKARTAPKRR